MSDATTTVEQDKPTAEDIAKEKRIAELSKELHTTCKKIKAADGLTSRRNEILVEMHSLGSKTMELAENVEGSLSKARIQQIIGNAKKSK